MMFEIWKLPSLCLVGGRIIGGDIRDEVGDEVEDDVRDEVGDEFGDVVVVMPSN